MATGLLPTWVSRALLPLPFGVGVGIAIGIVLRRILCKVLLPKTHSVSIRFRFRPRLRSVKPRCQGCPIAVELRDKGRGCSAVKKYGSTFGLFSVRERAAAFGAEFAIVNTRDKGTCATLTLPTA